MLFMLIFVRRPEAGSGAERSARVVAALAAASLFVLMVSPIVAVLTIYALYTRKQNNTCTYGYFIELLKGAFMVDLAILFHKDKYLGNFSVLFFIFH